MVRRNRNWLPPLLWGGLRFSHSHGWFFWSMRVGRCWVQSFSQNRRIHLTSLQTVLPCDELYPGLLSASAASRVFSGTVRAKTFGRAERLLGLQHLVPSGSQML